MASVAGRGSILVWTSDFRTARRLTRALGERGLRSVWAASLPEAIASVDREFPRAVACTLTGHGPSLIDLETLAAYQLLGHSFVALSPPPFWALTDRPAKYAPQIESLGLDIELVSAPSGATVLAERMAASFGEERLLPVSARDEGALILMEKRAEASYLARYFGARGLQARAAEGEREALESIRFRPPGMLVCEDFTLRTDEGSALWGWIENRGQPLPVVLVTGDREWIAHASPHAIPRSVISILGRPVSARALEAVMRRLLRVAHGTRVKLDEEREVTVP